VIATHYDVPIRAKTLRSEVNGIAGDSDINFQRGALASESSLSERSEPGRFLTVKPSRVFTAFPIEQ
jgi:hypothetical protein